MTNEIMVAGIIVGVLYIGMLIMFNRKMNKDFDNEMNNNIYSDKK